METAVTNENMNCEQQWRHFQKSKSSMSGRFRSRSELKSSIPKPSPRLRSADRKRNQLNGCPSFLSQPGCSSKIPISKFRSAEREKTSASLQYGYSSTVPPSDQHNFNRHSTNRPQSAHGYRNQYSHIKPKVNSRPTPSFMKSHNVYNMNSNESYVGYNKLSPIGSSEHSGNETQSLDSLKQNSKKKSHPVARNAYSHVKSKVKSMLTKPSRPSSPCRSPNVEGNKVDLETAKLSEDDNVQNNEALLEKQKQLLSIYNELKKMKLVNDLQPTEKEIFRIMQKKTLDHLERHTLENSFSLSEGAPEYLVTFQKEMKGIFNSWLQLICEFISSMQTANTNAHLTLPDSDAINLKEEIYNYLINLPYDGEPLSNMLKNIEEEHWKLMTIIMHSVTALTKEYEDLKDKHFRLEKTQDQIHFELKEELSILGEENKELDKKYATSVEKYNIEKAKAEQQEKTNLINQNKILEARKLMKTCEGKISVWENTIKKIEATYKTIDMAIRTREAANEKEFKHHQDVLNNYNEAKDTITKLSSELDDAKQSRQSVEQNNQELKNENSFLREEQEESSKKRRELEEELLKVSEKLKDLEREQETAGSPSPSETEHVKQEGKNSVDYASKLIIDDLTNDIHLKNNEIFKLKKKVNHILKQKSKNEELLTHQVVELQKKPNEIIIALKAKINELGYKVKDLLDERDDLERIIAQKTLELDQRDIMMKEHAQIVRAKDELIPMIQNKKCWEKECIEKLSTVIYEHRKTYYNQGSDGFYDKEPQSPRDYVKALERQYSMDPNLVEKELSFRQEKMHELFSLLERKQIEMIKLERRMRELQSALDQKEMSEKENEAFYSLQKELGDTKPARGRGIFSFFTSQDASPAD